MSPELFPKYEEKSGGYVSVRGLNSNNQGGAAGNNNGNSLKGDKKNNKKNKKLKKRGRKPKNATA